MDLQICLQALQNTDQNRMRNKTLSGLCLLMIVVLLSSPVFGQALTDRAQGDVYTNPTLRTPPPVDAPGGAGYVSPSAITLEQGDKNQIDQRLSALYMKAGDEFVAAGQAGLANDMYKKVTEVDPNSPMAQQKYYDTMGDVAPEASECEYHCQIRLRGKHKWKCIIPEGKNTPIWLQIDSAEVKDHFYTDPYTCTVGSWVRNQGAGAGNQTRRHPLGLMLIIFSVFIMKLIGVNHIIHYSGDVPEGENESWRLWKLASGHSWKI